MSSSYWGGHVLIDPNDMERMFSEEDGFSHLPSVWEETTEDGLLQLDNVREVLDQVPPREADFIELYFFKRLRQTAIADLYNISQPSVVYRLQRGARRLRYLIEMPDFDRGQMERDLADHVDEIDVKIMMGMVDTTCQSEVARYLGVTQGFVRHRFLRTLDRLEALEGMETYVAVFRHVSNNSNIMKNTCRASWPEEMIYSLS
jgi:hypothetical protein